MYAQAVRKPPIPRRGRANNQVRLNMFKRCAFSDVGLDCIKYLKLGEKTLSALIQTNDSVKKTKKTKPCSKRQIPWWHEKHPETRSESQDASSVI